MDMCEDIYAGRGCLVQKATDLKAMVELMTRDNYDVYVMDVNLGNRGGEDIAPAITVYSLIQERVKAQEARFVALSGNDMVVDRANAAGIPAKLKTECISELIELVR